MSKYILFFLVLVISNLPGKTWGQSLILSVEHEEKFKRIIFVPGTTIRIKTVDSEAKFSGRLAEVQDSSILLIKSFKMGNEGDTTTQVFKDIVLFKDIERIYVNGGTYWDYFKPMYAGTATVGGAVLMGGGLLNHYTDENRTPLDGTSMTVAASIMASGILVGLLGGKKYKKLGKKWTLKAIEQFNPATARVTKN